MMPERGLKSSGVGIDYFCMTIRLTVHSGFKKRLRRTRAWVCIKNKEIKQGTALLQNLDTMKRSCSLVKLTETCIPKRDGDLVIGQH